MCWVIGNICIMDYLFKEYYHMKECTLKPGDLVRMTTKWAEEHSTNSIPHMVMDPPYCNGGPNNDELVINMTTIDDKRRPFGKPRSGIIDAWEMVNK